MITIDDIKNATAHLVPDNAIPPRWDDLAVLLDLPRANGYKSIVELGSGLSTAVWLCGLYNAGTENAELETYESDPNWLRHTARYLKAVSQFCTDSWVSVTAHCVPLGFAFINQKVFWRYMGSSGTLNGLAKNSLVYVDGPELLDKTDETVCVFLPAVHDIVIDNRLATKERLRMLTKPMNYNQMDFNDLTEVALRNSLEPTHNEIQLTERLCLFKHSDNPRAH